MHQTVVEMAWSGVSHVVVNNSKKTLCGVPLNEDAVMYGHGKTCEKCQKRMQRRNRGKSRAQGGMRIY